MKFRLPEDVEKIICTLSAHGYEAYAVGGCVRDLFLGKEPKDWDITTSAAPLEVKALFPRTVDTGIQHGTVTVMLHHVGYEVTTYRIDGDYADGRHPNAVVFTRNISEDLKRRDFTINAMAYREETGILDLFSGMEDLKNGLIRAVGDPEARFTEDALRILRGIRFAAQLGFTIEPATFAAMKKLSGNLSKISRERVREEFLKTLLSDHPENLLLFSEISAMEGIIPGFRPEDERIIRILRILPKDRILRLAGIFLYGTEDARENAERAARTLRTLRFDSDTIKKTEHLLRFRDELLSTDECEIRHLVSRVGKDAFPAYLKLRRAADPDTSEAVFSKNEAYFQEILDCGLPVSQKDLALSGSDLIRLGVRPGKGMGEMLSEMLSAVLKDPSVNTTEGLTRFLLEKGNSLC